MAAGELEVEDRRPMRDMRRVDQFEDHRERHDGYAKHDQSVLALSRAHELDALSRSCVMVADGSLLERPSAPLNEYLASGSGPTVPRIPSCRPNVCFYFAERSQFHRRLNAPTEPTTVPTTNVTITIPAGSPRPLALPRTTPDPTSTQPARMADARRMSRFSRLARRLRCVRRALIAPPSRDTLL
jgi:hypothetical protein